MLSKEILLAILNGQPGFKDLEHQVLEGDGYDGIMDILTNIRNVSYPLIILEGKSVGQLTVLPGASDTFTQSIWVMDNMNRNESEKEVYDQAFHHGRMIISQLLQQYTAGRSELEGWQFQNISYSKRYGGPNVRGWEFTLTFKENIDLTTDGR